MMESVTINAHCANESDRGLQHCSVYSLAHFAAYEQSLRELTQKIDLAKIR